MAGRLSGHGVSERQQWATNASSRKNHGNPGTINAPRPSKSSARLVAVGLTSRRDMPDDVTTVRRRGLEGAGKWQFPG